MENVIKIKAHYNFTNGDVKNLDESGKFLKDEATVKRHQEALKFWFTNLFSGGYDRKYFDELERVGMTHVKINLPAHYVNAAMHFVKAYIHDRVRKEIERPEECSYLLKSVEKILDINLDVFTSSYIEEEKKFFLSHRVESYLIQFATRFSYGFNLILVLGLVFMGIMVLGLFVYDLTHVFLGDIETGLLSTLGSLLMLWVVIELMDTEIKHLRGGKFAVKVFVSV